MRLLPVLLASVVAAACTTTETPAFGEPVVVDGPMPRVEGAALPDGELTPADYEGTVTVVNVWATWCGPCRREQPVLRSLWETYRERGVSFVGINYRDDTAAAKEWLREFDVTYPSVVDEEGAYAAEFGFTGLPATYVADEAGQLRYRFYGEITRDDLARTIDQVIGGSPAP